MLDHFQLRFGKNRASSLTHFWADADKRRTRKVESESLDSVLGYPGVSRRESGAHSLASL